MSLLLVDKHRPTSLDKLDYHSDLSVALKNLAASDDFPHILFYGPSGAGKKTRIMALLRQLYGSGVEKLKVDQRSIKLPNRSDTIEATVLGSAYHIELNPSENGIYDRVVVQDVIKDIAQSQPLEVSKDSRPFKVVVLDEADLLTREAQQGLRRTMEKYMSTCRIIMSAQSLSKVMEAVRSRCLCLRVAAPKHEEIVKVLLLVAKKEGFGLPQPLAEEIARKSSRNLRRAILMLEATKVAGYPFQPNQQVQLPDWEMFIQHIGKLIMEQQSPQQLQMIRGKLYELLTHVIPPDVIMHRLTAFLMDKVDSELKYEVSYYAAVYEHRMQLGSKPIFHIEAFIAKFMSLFKAFVVRMFGE